MVGRGLWICLSTAVSEIVIRLRNSYAHVLEYYSGLYLLVIDPAATTSPRRRPGTLWRFDICHMAVLCAAFHQMSNVCDMCRIWIQ